MIRKGILKSFNSSAYTASVQIVGSLSVWLDSVKVSEALAAVDMVAGRSVAVLFLDPSNPDDAIVIGLWGVAAAFISDTAYNATTWNGVTDVAPSKNAVRDKIETLGTPTKEFFVPATNGSVQLAYDDHTGYEIDAAAEEAFIEFMVPADFSSLTACELIGIALAGNGSATMAIAIAVDYGAIDESASIHSSTAFAVATSVNATTDDLIKWGITTPLGSLAAGDYVGIRPYYSATALATDAIIIGVRLKYS